MCIVDRIRGGLSEFGGGFDGRLGTTVVLHAGEKRRVVFLATVLLDRAPSFEVFALAVRLTPSRQASGPLRRTGLQIPSISFKLVDLKFVAEQRSFSLNSFETKGSALFRRYSLQFARFVKNQTSRVFLFVYRC